MKSFNCNSLGVGRAFYVYRSGDCFFVPLHRDNRNSRIYGYVFNGSCVAYISVDFFVESGNEYFHCWFPDFENWIAFSAVNVISYMP